MLHNTALQPTTKPRCGFVAPEFQFNTKEVTNEKVNFYLASFIILSGCASTAPTQIGANTYYSSKTNTSGIFGDVSAVAGSLMAEGYKFCASKNKEFELVTKEVQNNIPGVRFGGASITFKCVDNANNPVMRKDNGVTTVEVK